MAERSLKTFLWIKAQIRICDLNLIPVFVIRKGDPNAGTVLLKMNRLKGEFELLCQARTAEGQRAWMSLTENQCVSEEIVNSKIQTQCKFDPDIWVLEIEDPNFKYVVQEPLI